MTSGCAERDGKRACELECVGGRGLAVHVPRRATQHASRWPGPGPTKRPRFVAWHRFARGRLASQNSIRAECGPAYGGVPCTDGSGVVVVFGGRKGTRRSGAPLLTRRAELNLSFAVHSVVYVALTCEEETFGLVLLRHGRCGREPAVWPRALWPQRTAGPSRPDTTEALCWSERREGGKCAARRTGTRSKHAADHGATHCARGSARRGTRLLLAFRELPNCGRFAPYSGSTVG